MGFGSDLLSFGSSIVGPVLGYKGQKDTNETNQAIASAATAASAEQAQRQMDFQERMSNTAYRRVVDDMRAAGLNPMLAYAQGGASQPQGAMGTVAVPQFKSPILGGLEGAQSAANIRQTRTQSELTTAQTQESQARATQALASAGQLDAMRDSIRQEMRSFEKRMERLGYETKSAEQRTRVDMYEGQRASERYNYLPGVIKAEAEELVARARLVGLEVPEAVANAALWSTVGETGKGAKFGLDLVKGAAMMRFGRGAALGNSAARVQRFGGFRP